MSTQRRASNRRKRQSERASEGFWRAMWDDQGYIFIYVAFLLRRRKEEMRVKCEVVWIRTGLVAWWEVGRCGRVGSDN